jgi:hypothetical protein
MSIGFDSDEVILEKLRGRLRRMTDEELIKFGKDVRKLAENPFQKQLERQERSLGGGTNCGIRKINEAKALRFQDSLPFFSYDRRKWLFPWVQFDSDVARQI